MNEGFFETVRVPMFYGTLPVWQRQPMERIIEEGRRRGRGVNDIAYVLATGYHETSRWRYDEEIGQGEGRDYGEAVLLIRGVRQIYYGRGDTQLTWLRNYARMSLALTLEHGREIDLVNKPELATQPEYSSLIIWEGMVRGMFTGHGLADYLSGDVPDFVGARRIVNGTDRADLIAGYARNFLAALEGEVIF